MHLKVKKQFRALGVVSRKMNPDTGAADRLIDPETRTFRVPFSSELPVERWFGNETLSHAPAAADLTRLNDGAPLLWNHDPDQIIGVVESAEIGPDRRGYANVRFSKNSLAEEKLNDVNDGIIRNVSFGYRIDQMEWQNPDQKDSEPNYLATRWSGLEVSLVSIPADQTVGFGRSDEDEANVVEVIEKKIPETGERKMDAELKALEVKVRDEAVSTERNRISAISALGEKHDLRDLSRQFVENGKSIEEARAAFLEKLGTRQKPVQENVNNLELTKEEARSYSVMNAIRAAAEGNWNNAGFERELSQEISKRTGKTTQGFFMPINIASGSVRAGSAGSYQVGSATLGGNLVQTNLLADSFIDLLRNKMLVVQMGAKTLSGLTGNVAIPKQSASAAANWISELADSTESEGTFSQVLMSPKTVSARSQMSRNMMMQSTPDIEMLTRNDLAQSVALAIDSAAIKGTGASGQPTGILNQAGIGSVAMGTNGAAFSNIDPLVDLETAVATANADFGALGYLTNPKQVGLLKKLKSTTGEYLWSGAVGSVVAAVPGEINGYMVGRSQQVPSNLTKGSSSGICSAMIFGNFADLIIGQWGPGIEILANPYGAGFNNGAIDLRALASVDVALRNAVSFAAITDLL
jgi:HK97 family phage major capsid protein/HK97 family phage prohead protease